MKLNKIFTFATLAATALFAASCSDKDEYEGPGTWDANANYANVYFPTTSLTEMVDPAADPVATVELYRHNTASAVTVPVKVVENTNEAFTVSDAVFAAGDSVATITIDYSKAEIGTAHKLVMQVEGADYVSSYSQDVAFTYTVTRVKWNSLGTGVFRDDFWFEESWDVEILQRDDDNSYYRIVDPFGPMAKYGLDGSQSEYLELHVMKKGDQINGITLSDGGIVDWYRICTGYVHSSYGAVVYALHPQNFTSASVNTYSIYSNNKVNAYLADGKTPGQIQLAPYWYMFGVGGWNYTDEATIFINFPGFVEEYTAEIDDFDWEPLFTGEFTSEQLGTKKDGVTIYKGVVNDSIEAANPGCFNRYIDANGTPYIIEAPYASGYDLLFQVKKGTVSTPEGYEIQETGLTALNQKVYAEILASSQFSDDLIELAINFRNKKGDVTYGTTTETLANITWSPVGTGTYTYTAVFTDEDEDGNKIPFVDEGYTVFQRDDKADTYKLTDWGYGVDFSFTWNQATNECVVAEQPSGYVSPTYGSVRVADFPHYNSNYGYDKYPCYYDPETSTFHFVLIYFVDGGYFGYGEETLEVAWDASGNARVKSRSSKYHTISVGEMSLIKNGKFQKGNRFVPQKTTPDALKSLRLGKIENPGSLVD